MESVEGLKQNLKQNFEELARATIESDWIKDLLKAGSDLLQMLTNIVSEDTLVHTSISMITEAVKGLASIVEGLTGNKGIAGLISSFVTLKAVTSGFNLFRGNKNGSGKIIDFQNWRENALNAQPVKIRAIRLEIIA